MTHQFRSGDVVKHGPSGETWGLACADMERNEVMPCGWPCTIAKASDCTLVEAATDEKHVEMVMNWANKSGEGDIRVSRCRELAKSIHLKSLMVKIEYPAGTPQQVVADAVAKMEEVAKNYFALSGGGDLEVTVEQPK